MQNIEVAGLIDRRPGVAAQERMEHRPRLRPEQTSALRPAILRGLAFLLALGAVLVPSNGQEQSSQASPAADRRQRARDFDLRAQQRTGILIPLYVYPGDVRQNPAYNRLLDLKRRYETVPIWVIVNPASGPGTRVDPRYTRAIDRLRGAGCVVLGYVATSYAERSQAEVRQEIDAWLAMYPQVHGIFFDEMIYEDTEAGARSQAAFSRYAREAGCSPIVGNPGADTPGRYFDAEAADVIVIHEGSEFPSEDRLHGDRPGGYADHPPFTRGVLVHSQANLDRGWLRMARKYVRWIYVTEDMYRPGDPQAANPWDRLSRHLDELCEQLAED